MEGIIQAFLDRVSGVGWIDNQTVEAVREKVWITRSEKQFHDSNAAAFPNPLSLFTDPFFSLFSFSL